MIYVALAEAAIIALLVWLSARERATHDKALLDLMAQAGVEQARLLNRIANPSAVQPLHTEKRMRSAEDIEAEREYQKALAQVGTVTDAH